MEPLIASLEDCRICHLPRGIGQMWLGMVVVKRGHYAPIDQNFDLPGVGEVPLYIHRDMTDNYYLIHEPV